MRTLKTLLPRSVKRAILWCYVHALALSCQLSPSEIRLSLAGVLPPRGRFIRGGKVKLIHLRDRFGDHRWRFNLLYVVSSTLPSNPDIWIRILKRAGVKIVWNQNGVAYPAWAGEQTNVDRINAPMRLLREADLVVYQSVFCKESADRHVAPAAGHWVIVPNSVDTTKFSPTSKLSDRPLTLLVMGSHFTPEKVLIPLQALALLRQSGIDVRMQLAGRFEWPNAAADMKTEIERLVLGDVVQVHGSFLQEEAPDIYRSAHIFVHLKYMDPCPTAVIEAMACGLPVVGSASGGMPELVDDHSGILIPVPKDWDHMHYPTAQAVAEAVKTIASDLPRWSAATRDNAVRRFGSTQWVQKHEELFHELLP